MDTHDPVPTVVDPRATGPAPTRPDPRDRTVLRVAGGALVLTSVLLLLLDPGQGPALETVTGPQALAHFADTLDTRHWLGIGAVLAIASWLVSLAGFRQACTRRQPGGVWGDLVLGAGLLVAVNWMLLGAVVGIPSTVDLDRTSLEAAQVWYLLDALAGSFGNMAVVGQLLVAVGIGAAGLRAGLLHRPVAWFALAVAACPVLSLVTEVSGLQEVSTGLFYAAIFGFVLVLLSSGVSLLVRSRTR